MQFSYLELGVHNWNRSIDAALLGNRFLKPGSENITYRNGSTNAYRVIRRGSVIAIIDIDFRQ